MADARGLPHVVHGPHHRLAALHYLSDVSQRQHALVYPVEMHHVSPLELRKRRYVRSAVCDVYLEKMIFREPQMIVYAPSFPQKVPAGAHPAGHFRHGDAVGLLVTHKHLCLLAAVDERLQQSSCGNRRSSGTLACIYNQYIHFACPTFSPYLRLQTGFLKTPYCFPECSLSYAKIAQGECRNKAGKTTFYQTWYCRTDAYLMQR